MDIKKFLTRPYIARLIVMIIGNTILAGGVATFKLSGLGNDPFTGMVMAWADRFGIDFPIFLIMVNVVLFVFQFIAGKYTIGAGTLMNAVVNGYIVTFVYGFETKLLGTAFAFPVRVVIVFAGVLLCGFGLSLYQTSNMGIAPFDCISIITSNKWKKLPYFWQRLIGDSICAVFCYLGGGIVGLGTLVCAFGLGPFVHFFDDHFTAAMLTKVTGTEIKGH